MTIDSVNRQVFLARANCSAEEFGKGFDNSFIYRMGAYTIMTICIVIGVALIVGYFVVRECEKLI
jgi:hypothetical protein